MVLQRKTPLQFIKFALINIFTQHKQNKHQFSWLWKKVSLKNGSKGSLQEFLDNNQYNKSGILMYERVFGKGFVSPGGMTTTKVVILVLSPVFIVFSCPTAASPFSFHHL